MSNARKVLIFGNSGSGKSTLAKKLSHSEGLAHLDLDNLAWTEIDDKPVRQSLAESEKEIKEFTQANDTWVVEGCYTDLLELLVDAASEVIFLNLPIEQCVANAKSRPWEPHKYPTKEAQDANLEMLIGWIRDYETRTDTFSHQAHFDFYNNFKGVKKLVEENTD